MHKTQQKEDIERYNRHHTPTRHYHTNRPPHHQSPESHNQLRLRPNTTSKNRNHQLQRHRKRRQSTLQFLMDIRGRHNGNGLHRIPQLLLQRDLHSDSSRDRFPPTTSPSSTEHRHHQLPPLQLRHSQRHRQHRNRLQRQLILRPPAKPTTTRQHHRTQLLHRRRMARRRLLLPERSRMVQRVQNPL